MSSVNRRLHGIFANAISLESLPSKTKTSVAVKSLAKTASARDRSLQKLVDNFKKSSEREKFRAKRSWYEKTVRHLAAAEKFSMIEEILEAQKKYKDITDEGFAIRLITLYGKSGMLDHARKLFDELPQLNCERTSKAFNALLKACVNAKKFDKAIEFFQELRSCASIELNLVSFNIIIHAACEMGSFENAMSTLNDMKDNGMEPDIISFNTLLDALFKAGLFSSAENLWAMMESKNIAPNIRSYNSMLRGLTYDNRIHEAAELVSVMESKGTEPDVYSYNILIKGFSDGGNLKEAKRWYEELLKHQCSPSLVTFTSLVSLYLEKVELDMAFELCLEVINRRLFIKSPELKKVVDGLMKEDKVELATELVEHVNSAKYLKYKLELPIKVRK